MAKFKVLKAGETDINSTDIWRFSVHSDHPTQKVHSASTTTIVIPAGTTFGSKAIANPIGYAASVHAMFLINGSRYIKVNGHRRALRPVDGSDQIYSVNVTNSTITFRADANISTVNAPSDISITVYYIIIYESI